MKLSTFFSTVFCGLVLAAGLILPNQLQAAAGSPAITPSIADCWTESGMDIEDGEFIVSLETKQITKANLLKIMSGLSGRMLEPVGYPLIFDESMFIHVRANARGETMTRGELKAAVLTELQSVLGLSKGTAASCNFHAYPAPAVGVRN